ncbi:hypothetical protein FA95DRAFT_1612312 [Auriscalpium vulgare]|uniref:Uncharacterized protein n=1 Tax=Auriscalpium vulgare TaxID=40419 RepID=A0ACB8R6S4_9AGAM|nr:hypothetical protein FA95DRAFT_1612312 [Auriscalpium vulgare]
MPFAGLLKALAIAGLVGLAVGAIVTPIVAPAVVSVFGFGAAGPVAGSLAAGIQSGLGSVAVGSSFAIVQSIGMGGAMPLVGLICGAAIVGVVAVIGRALVGLWQRFVL